MPLNTYTLNSRTLGGPRVPYKIDYPATKLVELDQNVVLRVNDARRLVLLDQNVQAVTDYAATKLVQLDQSVSANYPARRLVQLNQNVYDQDAPAGSAVVPMCVVYIDGQDVTGRVLISGVSVSHGEDQSASADLVLLYETDAPVMIPSLNGKPLVIEAFTDPSDANSETWRLFTGWIERSSYDRAQRAVRITGSDLRGERLGDSDKDELLQLTQAVYSEVTQTEGADGEDFVSEMMKTVSGSLVYNRDGELTFYSWLIDGETPSLTMIDNDVAYEDIKIDYQTRSDVVNSVTIKMSYRYTGLRTIQTTVEAIQQYQEWGGKYAGSFLRDTIIDRVESGFSPWIATEYTLQDMPTVRQARERLGALLIYRPNPYRCMGYTANLERYIAQPITEEYEITVTAPQSVRAYGKKITGSTMNFSVDAYADFERSDFEDRDAVYTPTTQSSPNRLFEWPTGGTLAKYGDNPALASYAADVVGGTLPVVDTKRPLFNAGTLAATLMARKEIRASHRKNFIEVLKYDLTQVDVGDVVELDTRVISAIGQCTGITYSISDSAGMTTLIKLQISSMDDDGAAPIEDWTAPPAPVLTVPPSPDTIPAKRTVNANGSINFNREEEKLEGQAPEVGTDYTDEGVTEVAVEYEMALENQSITLINGW